MSSSTEVARRNTHGLLILDLEKQNLCEFGFGPKISLGSYVVVVFCIFCCCSCCIDFLRFLAGKTPTLGFRDLGIEGSRFEFKLGLRVQCCLRDAAQAQKNT